MQKHASGGTQGGAHQIHKQVTSFLLGLTLKPLEELPEPVAMWTVPYEQLLTEQQKAVWFTNGSFKINGQHLIRKSTTSRPAGGKTEEGKNKWSQ